MEIQKKYDEYKKMVDYHAGKCSHYKGHSKSKYMKHYRYYKYFYVKMTYYAKKCGIMVEKEVNHHHGQEHCESTHTHYKHYYHHHHIDKHYNHCHKKR
ncbi:hypothetical protein BEP19_09650 [Ammoniphilus oxalaticus]|uniref:Uncharacterized protein n=1 Tax=Ammoniphilus oxalaticus TaxID=66863 RepID=A0A419SL42_9BACL|nr:hypothetical protein BEP19_09650 [Ammoniphilus oxalaticus]